MKISFCFFALQSSGRPNLHIYYATLITKCFLIILFSIAAFSVNAQDSVKYKFVVYDPAANVDMSRNIAFSYQRIILDKNIFKEDELFSRTSAGLTNVVFKKEKDAWYIKNSTGEWSLFYSSTDSTPTNTEMLVDDKIYKVRWLGERLLNNVMIPTFYLYPPAGIVEHPKPSYYFDCVNGIIAIRVDDHTYIRSDLQKTSEGISINSLNLR